MRTIGFLGAFVMSVVLAPECLMRGACLYPDTKPLGIPFLTISTKEIFPMSCVRFCSLTDSCASGTLDPLEAICQIYKENDPFGIIQDNDTSHWLFQAVGVPCIRVSWVVIFGRINKNPSVLKKCPQRLVDHIILKLCIQIFLLLLKSVDNESRVLNQLSPN